MGGAGPEGGVRVLNRLGLARGTMADGVFSPSRDRIMEIEGNPFFPVPKPVAPAGIEVDERAGIVVLSDPSRPGIWSFGVGAGPDASEINVVDVGLAVGSAEPGELDYDGGTDSLYVAVTNGTVYVYDNYRSVPGDVPDRTIAVSDAVGASQVSTSLRGLVHDAERDLLIVSDVGPGAAMGNDGAIYVLEGARTASGLTAPPDHDPGREHRIGRAPGLAWDGSSLWVADKENGTISRFDDLLTLDGDVAPSASLAVPDVISVKLRAEGLAPTVGGSIQ